MRTKWNSSAASIQWRIMSGESLREDNGSGHCILGDPDRPDRRVLRNANYLVGFRGYYPDSGNIAMIRRATKGEVSASDLRDHLIRYGV